VSCFYLEEAMRIQPVQGTGMNAGYDAATKSITISNEGNTPILYFKIGSKIPKDKEDLTKGYYLFYEFDEVFWDGVDFSVIEGGLSAKYETRETCPKLYSMPHDYDDPSNLSNFSTTYGISGEGLIYIGRYRGVDSSDGRDVYEYLRSLDPSSKLLVKIDTNKEPVNGYYPLLSYSSLDNSGTFQNKFWGKEINQSELKPQGYYLAFYSGGSYNPYPNDPENSDIRPTVAVFNNSISGPIGVTVVTDVTCTNGSISATYGTFYPTETAYIVQDNKKTFVSLIDTPSSYNGAANYYVAVNPNSNGLYFTTSPPPSGFVPQISFTNLNDGPKSYPSFSNAILSSNVNYSNQLEWLQVTMTQYQSIVPNQAYLKTNMSWSLVNDKQSPGANMYYGTNENGVKGWYQLPGV
jgi:hypothetical protein